MSDSTNITNKETSNFLLGFAVACMFWIIGISLYGSKSGRVYDCGMAEWHPDIPKEVKQACREKARENQEQRVPKLGTGNVV